MIIQRLYNIWQFTQVFNENWSEQTQSKNGTEDKIIILEVEMCASWLKTAIEVRPDTIQEQLSCSYPS
jgi:hypothetical protein